MQSSAGIENKLNTMTTEYANQMKELTKSA